MVCFVRRSTIDYDIRLKKYVDACVETRTQYIAITWDRQKNCTNVFPNEIQYKVTAPYGAKWKNFFALIGWQVFMFWQLLINWSKYRVIHACNLEVFIFVLPFRLFGKKIVFDIYDSVKENLETKVAKYADVLILPHENRLEQIQLKKDDVKSFLEVENVPQIKNDIKEKSNVDFPIKIHLSYVGILEAKFRGLENLLEFVFADDRFVLNIAGTGALEVLVKEYADKCDRIVYHGKVLYSHGLEIMNNSDFIVAIYYSWRPRHKYASPNKFYESLCLGKPIITSKDTLVGLQVESENTGYVIDDNPESFKKLFKEIDTDSFKEEYKTKSNNCCVLWRDKYSEYFNNKLKDEYINVINGLNK